MKTIPTEILLQKWQNLFQESAFEVELTADQSPTLRMLGPPAENSSRAESMHHSGGAATETKYIYSQVIEAALSAYLVQPRLNQQFATAVIGLGLGYIEICWALNLLKKKLGPSNEITLDTFETVSKLKSLFATWVSSPRDHHTISSSENEEISIYDFVVQKIQPEAQLVEVIGILNQALQQDHLRFHENLLSFQKNTQWNVICYDAFSQKTSHPLWQKDFLDYFLERHAASDCVFTTYACTGVLKKCLQEKGFTLLKRPGFQGKRDSTLAVRGYFSTDLSLFQTF